ncbi:hypothetical protein NLX67_22085 [Domibacillus sp. A3M-37]|uniref:hypothetical protein n=1 Tax=Domibacillus sp. A3M-37 TaxID=2962037 RepID=UPI0020B84F2E|nr:hypothetical protein [Domibacillus sp. A3M-37]MCP3765004.1 hypothetical protein [Domibacillus sp. A3M-37]
MGFRFENREDISDVWFNPDYSNADHDEDREHNQNDRDDVSDRRDDRDEDREHRQDDRDDVRDRRDNRDKDKKRPWFFTL